MTPDSTFTQGVSRAQMSRWDFAELVARQSTESGMRLCAARYAPDTSTWQMPRDLPFIYLKTLFLAGRCPAESATALAEIAARICSDAAVPT